MISFIKNSIPKVSPALLKFALLFAFLPAIINGQNNESIVDAYEDYADSAREIIYVHLNKSTYIKGESIGFTAYVLDKKRKMPSMLTKNLYVSIETMDQVPVKQKLLQVENGVASNIFNLDDDFTTGSYLVKAYTNWSRNFNEQNYFSAVISVIDPATDSTIKVEQVENALDAQFLPESGHLLANVVNKVGVVIKDPKGYGVSNATGSLYNQSGDLLTTFEVNDLGIGQFPIKPSVGESYKVVITDNYKDYEFSLNQKVELTGVVLSTAQSGNQLMLNVVTNERSMNFLKGRNYKLSFHNGSDVQVENLIFSDNTTIFKRFNISQLPPGITVFTLFNENNKPVAERLFFNYKGIELYQSSGVQMTQVGRDSVDISLNFNKINPAEMNNISVSVLPQESISYKHNHNLASYSYLQPYVKGDIEQANYYFTDVTNKTMLDLDMLLLTQGWSSYNWNQIFNSSNLRPYDFEQGISIKANVNGNKEGAATYMVHPIEDKTPVFFNLEDGQNSFQLDYAFYTDKDKVILSEVTKSDDLRPARLYLQATPSTVPSLNIKELPLDPKPDYNTITSLQDNKMATSMEGVQELEEIVIDIERETNTLKTRELEKYSYGQVGIISDEDRISYLSVADYLFYKYRVGSVVDDNGNLRFINPRGSGSIIGGGPMQLFLDGFPLDAAEQLRDMPLAQIDYIEVNLSGLGEGIRGSNGAIKIYQSEKSTFQYYDIKTSQKYDLPLYFSSDKKFYAPVYRYRSDDFYKNYGTIDWEPRLTVDNNRNVTVRIEKPLIPITLHIEGIDAGGNLIYEEKTIDVN